MERTKKVITNARYITSESSAFINVEPRKRAVPLGCRVDEATRAMGFLGKVAEQSSGRSILDFGIWVDLAFPHVIGIFGKRGTGKSFDLGVFVESIAGLQSVVNDTLLSTSVIVFDVQNQFWTLALHPNKELPEDEMHMKMLVDWGLIPSCISNVTLWLPAGCTSNLPETQTFRLSPCQLEDDDWLALLELERYSPLGQALIALLSDGGNREPSAMAARANPGRTLSSFQQATIDALRWRLQALAKTNLVGEPGINVEQLLVSGRISVLLLRDIPESLRALSVGVLMRICSTRMGLYHQTRRVARRYKKKLPEGDLPQRLWVIIDEAHVVAPREGRSAATLPLVDYVKRGRDAGLSMVFATQQPSGVDNRLMSQVDMTITHSLGFETDIQAALARMPTRTSIIYERAGFRLPLLGDVVRSLDPGEAIIADSANGRIFIGRIRPRLSAHGGNTPMID